MGDKPDIQRLIGDLVRLGTVASVDHAKATCRVRLDQIVSGDVPWAGGRAGATRTWSPPSVDEQVVLICPEGDIAAGFIIPGVYSNARPAPAATEGMASCSTLVKRGASPNQIMSAAVEAKDLFDAVQDLLLRLTSFLSDGAGPAEGFDGGRPE